MIDIVFVRGVVPVFVPVVARVIDFVFDRIVCVLCFDFCLYSSYFLFRVFLLFLSLDFCFLFVLCSVFVTFFC